MEYRVTFPLAVQLIDFDNGCEWVTKEAGTYRMEVIENPHHKHFFKWFVIKGTRIGISMIAFWEIEDQIAACGLPGINLVTIEIVRRKVS